jgi:hypothetical protein
MSTAGVQGLEPGLGCPRVLAPAKAASGVSSGDDWGSRRSVRRICGPLRRSSEYLELLKGSSQAASVRLLARICWLRRRALVG